MKTTVLLTRIGFGAGVRESRPRGRERGFTMVELLVIMMIVALLASLALPVFLRQREKAWMAQSESALAGAIRAIEDCAVESGGNFDAANTNGLTCALPSTLVADHGLRFRIGLSLTIHGITAHRYCIQVEHPDLDPGHPGKVLRVDNGANREPLPGPCPS